jgi:hypothetical protein
MSPLSDTRCLSRRNSPEGHCDGDVVLTFLRFGPHASTFLSPLAPPVYAARLPRYYGDSDFRRGVPSDARWPFGRGWFHRTGTASPPRFSLLVSSELPTIPTPITTAPFRHDRILALLHRRGLPRLSSGRTVTGRKDRRRAVKGSSVNRRLPDRLGRIEFVLLRTGRSPLVALHLSFRKRSYRWLQAGNVSLTGTYTLQFRRLHRRTISRHPCRDSLALSS